jgi:6-phosphogluconolactonase
VLPSSGSDPATTEPLEDLATAGEPKVFVSRDPDALADAAAVRLAERLVEAVALRGRADVALTGGSTPKAMYRRLLDRQLRDRIDWQRVHLWWGDERFVPRTDPLSNASLADEELLAPDGIPIPADNVHPFPADRAIRDGLGPDWCAATYAAEVVAAVPAREGWPSFDVVLVGIGGDGHLLSVFPGSPALSSHLVALAIPAPTHIEPHVERVTLNPAVIVTARRVLAMATGAAKAPVIAAILEGARDPLALPGVLARRSSATWLIDATAASGLGRTTRIGDPTADGVLLRPATGADAGEVAEVWLASFSATYDFPHAHTDDEVRQWIRDDLLPGSETWLAIESDGSIAGFMALGPDMLDHLYLRPDRTGRGIGSRFVGLAKSLRPAGLELYTFQVNSGARRFYERHGFRVVDTDPGGRNEEGQPDVRYRWLPTDAAAGD